MTDQPHAAKSPLCSTASTALGGFVLTLVGLYLLWSTPHVVLNFIILAGGVTYLTTGLFSTEMPRLTRPSALVEMRVARVLNVKNMQARLLLFGFFFALASRSAAGDFLKAHSPFHPVFWFAGIVLVLVGLWRTEGRAPKFRANPRVLVPAAILFIIAALGRGLDLSNVPYGVNGDEVVKKTLEMKDWNDGFDAKVRQYKNLVKAGIIDPTKVVRNALMNASSAAIMLLTTEAAVADTPKKDGCCSAGGGGMPGGMPPMM